MTWKWRSQLLKRDRRPIHNYARKKKPCRGWLELRDHGIHGTCINTRKHVATREVVGSRTLAVSGGVSHWSMARRKEAVRMRKVPAQLAALDVEL